MGFEPKQMYFWKIFGGYGTKAEKAGEKKAAKEEGITKPKKSRARKQRDKMAMADAKKSVDPRKTGYGTAFPGTPEGDVVREKQTGGARPKVKAGVKTKGGEYFKYKKKSRTAQSFREAFAENRKAGKKTFKWQGRSYSTATADDKKKAAAAKKKTKKVVGSKKPGAVYKGKPSSKGLGLDKRGALEKQLDKNRQKKAGPKNK